MVGFLPAADHSSPASFASSYYFSLPLGILIAQGFGPSSRLFCFHTYSHVFKYRLCADTVDIYL